MSQNPNNLGPMAAMQNYTPSLSGATDNPVPTFTTQIGRFMFLGGLLFLYFRIVTSTMTKNTLTDPVLVNLPVPAATLASAVWQGSGRCENTTPIPNPVYTEIASAATTLTFRANAAAGNASLPMTYAVASPGIGVLTNTITFNGSIFYEV